MSGVKESVALPLTFCRDTKKLLEESKDSRFVESMYLTNSVLHCTTKSLHPQYVRKRELFWSHPFDDNTTNERLSTFSNDSYGGPNYRIDTTKGRVLSFCRGQPHSGWAQLAVQCHRQHVRVSPLSFERQLYVELPHPHSSPQHRCHRPL